MTAVVRQGQLVDNKQMTPIWIVDEAQNLPAEFFSDFPTFLNFAFDSRDLLSVWLVGHPNLASRIQTRVALLPIVEGERFAQLVAHGL